MEFRRSNRPCQQDRPYRQGRPCHQDRPVTIEVESYGISWNLVKDSSCDN